MIEEEKQEIVDRLFEKVKDELLKNQEEVYLGLPAIASNLVLERGKMFELNKQMYADHKEFKGHEQTVQAVVQETEGDNPTMDYDDILKIAIPEVKKRLKSTEGLSMTNTSGAQPDRTYKRLDRPSMSRCGTL